MRTGFILSSGGMTCFTVTVTAPASGSVTNVAGVGNRTADPNPANNASTLVSAVTPLADLGVGLAQAPLFFEWSGGHRDLPSFPTRRSSDLASSVVVTDTLPASVTFVSGTGGVTPNGL